MKPKYNIAQVLWDEVSEEEYLADQDDIETETENRRQNLSEEKISIRSNT